MTLDGLPVGTIRSNMADIQITGDDWCRSVGSHRFAEEKDGTKWCRDCWKTEKEINGEKEIGGSEAGTGDC